MQMIYIDGAERTTTHAKCIDHYFCPEPRSREGHGDDSDDRAV